MGLKANICQVCGGTLKNCGTYYKCVCCDTEYRIDEAMSKEEMNTYFRKLNAFEDAERNLSVSPPKFDDAESEFELIVQKYPDWSAGYWGLVRAKFGIKFEQDLSGKAVPSCYKSTYEDFRDTDEYKKAVALAETPELRQSYEKMAEYIARVAKEWRAEEQKYDYDVFISFKASNDLDGSETRDAREMHKLYDLLKDKGYRVFFSPVTLITDGVVGKGSEPYIFNALDKAKALIVYGSKKEYFSSTWVQNEWQRYLRAIKAGKKEKGCSGLMSITIPNSVTSIGDSAFSDCSGLKSITIPNGVMRIGRSAFKNCSGLTSIIIPNSVRYIEGRAFEGCKGLTSITIPSSVTSIEPYTFKACLGLTSITIPNSVTSIGPDAFQGCLSLASIIIPKNVEYIAMSTFAFCKNLKKAIVPKKTHIDPKAFSNFTIIERY